MTQPVDVDLNLGGDYTQGVTQATAATEGLATALNAIQAPSRSVQQALTAATPNKTHLAAWGGFTAAAAYWQGQTSGIRATASAAGQSMRVLEGDVRRLASSFPIGTSGAVQLVQAVQGLGASQQRVLPLAVTFERLAAATNSFGPDMAQNFGQLNREMASLDPNRVARFGDVVTTLAAKTGASAMGMVNFAHAIAPVAQQAGIGESAVLGISAAFVKLGDDGGAAATAVNKILGDLNRSVREGSNDMAAYAQITGMTVQQFKALYEANPAQALTQVTTAIGRAGPRGQMELESLGLEGVRTQRALLQLSQSGGLGATINQAIGAYGNGSTQTAAAAALGGLNSSLTELRSTAGQTADALGGPFLHILTRITDLAKVGLGPLNSILGSRLGQEGILGFGALAATGLVARRVVRPLGGLAIAGQLATSGPFRSLAGGYAVGRVGEEAALAGATEGMMTGRFGRDAIAMQMMGGPYGRGFMQPVNLSSMRAGQLLGRFRSDLAGEDFIPGGGTGGSVLRRGARAGIAASSLAYEGWMRTFADPFHQAVTPSGERVSMLTAREGGLFSQANQVRQQAGMRAALGFLEKESTGGARAIGRLTSATLGATRAVTTFAGRAAEAGIAAGGTMLGGVGRAGLDLVGGPLGAALIGGSALYGLYQHQKSQTASINDTMRNTDVYSVENSWRDAVGAASQAALSMADAMTSATNTINTSVQNFAAARVVSNSDIVAAGNYNPRNERRNAVLPYVGSNADIQAQIQAGALGGLTPQDMQGAKTQLIKQGVPVDRINAILAGIRTGGTGGRLDSSTVSGLALAYRTAAHSYDVHGHGLMDTDVYAGRDAQKVAQEISSALGQQQSNLSEKFGSRYATQQTVRSLSALLNQLPPGRRYTLSHALAASLGYTGSGGFFNAQDLLGAKGVSIGGMSGSDLTSLLSGPDIAHHLQPSIMEAPLRSVGASALLPFFASARAAAPFLGGQRAAEYVASGHEADVGAQTRAVNEMVNASVRAGTSLTDLATQATKATGVTADWQQQLLESIAAEAQFRQNVSLQGAGRGLTLSAQVGSDLKTLAAGPGVDPNGFQAKQYAQAKQDLADQRGSLISFYQQRVMAQYQYQIQVGRSQEDFQRQTSRSEQDYLRGRYRAFRDYNIQVTREQQDAAQQMYNPYQRIQAKPVWDVFNLAGNRSEQIQALRQQLGNIRELKSLGLSQATIDQLQLYDPNNAQQTQQLVADLEANRSEVGVLNRQSVTEQRLAGQLGAQSPQFRRQAEDFKRSLSDQQRDFQIGQSRARTDFGIAMSRMAQDLHTQDLEITNDMTKLTKDMNDILHGQAVDLQNQVTNSLQSTLESARVLMPQITAALNGGKVGVAAGGGPGGTTSSGISATGSTSGGGYGNTGATVSTFSDTLNPRTGRPIATATQSNYYVKPGTAMIYGGAISGSGAGSYDYAPDDAFIRQHPADPNFNRSIAKRMAPKWATGSEWQSLDYLWSTESGWNQYSDNAGSDAYGIPQALPGSKMSTKGRDWRTNPATQIAWGLDYIRGRYGDPNKAAAHERRFNWYAAGGLFGGPTIAGLGEGGPEAAIPLNAMGLNFMVNALRQYVSSADAKMIGSGGMASATHIYHTNDTYHYDSRLDFTGAKVEVKASNPREFADQIREKERADNLTATRGVRRGG